MGMEPSSARKASSPLYSSSRTGMGYLIGNPNLVFSMPTKTERASFLPSRKTVEQLPDGMTARISSSLMGIT